VESKDLESSRASTVMAEEVTPPAAAGAEEEDPLAAVANWRKIKDLNRCRLCSCHGARPALNTLAYRLGQGGMLVPSCLPMHTGCRLLQEWNHHAE
jgi:hypothetical protein